MSSSTPRKIFSLIPRSDLSKPGEKVIDSIHPLRDDYKFKESVSIPGAKFLFLRFDSRHSAS